MNTYANEIEAGDILLPNQTFHVADDSGLLISGDEHRLFTSYLVTYTEYAGTDHQGREQTRIGIRPHQSVGLHIPIIVPSARVVRTA